ncbi:hypothetical protein GA0115238_12181 [Streptomyces sp. di50b]|nr:hypothetical protein GA0115238_12181 [Streptomyces sp. di50b]
MTHALLERGFEVTAVDGSAEMRERVRGARTIWAVAAVCVRCDGGRPCRCPGARLHG